MTDGNFKGVIKATHSYHLKKKSYITILLQFRTKMIKKKIKWYKDNKGVICVDSLLQKNKS